MHSMLPPDIAAAPHAVQQHYKTMLADGQTERFAAMCALQIAPGTKGSDRAFMEGRSNNQQFDDMPKLSAQWMIKEANKAGINVTGKYYCGGLADKRGWRDPEAWVSSSDDVMRVAKKRRLHVRGALNYDPGVPDPKRTVINENIVRREVAKELRRNPKAKAGEVRERIIEKHAYRPKGRNV